VSRVYHAVDNKDLIVCPKCGHGEFIRIQTGYEQHVPCRIFADGKAAICNYEDEVLEEQNDGGDWSRTIVCGRCGYELTDEDVSFKRGEDEEVTISEIDCLAPEDVGPETVKKHGAKAET